MPSSDDPLTEIHFGSGERLCVRNSLSETRALVQAGLTNRPQLVEVIAENGDSLIFNAWQVKYIMVRDAIGE